MATLVKGKKQQRRLTSVPREMRETVTRLLLESFSYMDSPTFRHKKVEQELFTEDAERELPLTSWYQPTRDDVADLGSGSPPQLMKGPEERLMFLRFNYCKKRLSALQKQIRTGGLTYERATEFLDWHRKFEHFREYLVRTNLALVLAMAKRTRLGDVDFAEIVSEGNMALLRAIDKFSVDRGFKFSTYACRAILKAFSRTAMKSSKHRTRFPVEFEPEMEQSDWADRRRDKVEEDCIDELKAIVDRNLADLSSVEQTVIRRRFNWQQAEESPMTLEEVGRIIGVTKERVRQIQNKALAKIRTVMEDGVLRIHPRTEEESKAMAESRAVSAPAESRSPLSNINSANL
jgi:RNA polymerase sigma factor (sigma-70 family)